MTHTWWGRKQVAGLALLSLGQCRASTAWGHHLPGCTYGIIEPSLHENQSTAVLFLLVAHFSCHKQTLARYWKCFSFWSELSLLHLLAGSFAPLWHIGCLKGIETLLDPLRGLTGRLTHPGENIALICVLDVALKYNFSCLRELRLILVSQVASAVKILNMGLRARIYIYAAMSLLMGSSRHLFAPGKPFYIPVIASQVFNSTEDAKWQQVHPLLMSFFSQTVISKCHLTPNYPQHYFYIFFTV